MLAGSGLRAARTLVVSAAHDGPLKLTCRLAASHSRCFHQSSVRTTDGIFRGLADERLPVPWIEAFRRQQAWDNTPIPKIQPEERDLSPRKMKDSYHRVVLPLAQDPWLSDTYLNSSGHIRLGAVLMDLDALSGIIVYKHTGPGVTVVTAALDRITIAHPLTEICDLEYSGQVTYSSGRSSAEITCRVAKAREEGDPSKPEDVLLTCTFTMVALDPATKKSVKIPTLIRETPEEEEIFKAGEAKSLAKKEMAKTSLQQVEPNDAESALIHQMWLKRESWKTKTPGSPDGRPFNVASVASTELRNASIMQPQYRNRHQTMIFGGFHLKQTFELAFCCAANFAHARPTFISAEPCTFRNPVPVGSVLYLTAKVVYTNPSFLDEGDSVSEQADPSNPVTRVSIQVDSVSRDVEGTQTNPTGQFNYTFSVPTDKRVIPHTYDEYMMYVEARRRAQLNDVQTQADQEISAKGDNLIE